MSEDPLLGLFQISPPRIIMEVVIIYGPVVAGLAWALSLLWRRVGLREMFALVGFFGLGIWWMMFLIALNR